PCGVTHKLAVVASGSAAHLRSGEYTYLAATMPQQSGRSSHLRFVPTSWPTSDTRWRVPRGSSFGGVTARYLLGRGSRRSWRKATPYTGDSFQRLTAARAAAGGGLGVCGRHLHADAAPLPLTEPHNAQRTARHMAQQDGRPDIGGAQAARRLEERAQAERHDGLGDDRDEERRAGVARTLESPGEGNRAVDEQPGHAEEAEQLPPEADDDRPGNAETPEQAPRDGQEDKP